MQTVLGPLLFNLSFIKTWSSGIYLSSNTESVIWNYATVLCMYSYTW